MTPPLERKGGQTYKIFRGQSIFGRGGQQGAVFPFAIKGAEKIFIPIFDPSSQAQMIANEFALKAGIGVMNNERVWGIRVRDDAVFLTYSGDNYCGITLSDNEMTCCSKSAVDFVRKYFSQVWNVSSFLDKVRPIILSTSNIERAQKPVVEAQANKQKHSDKQSVGFHR